MIKIFLTFILLFSILLSNENFDINLAQKYENSGDSKNTLDYCNKFAKKRDDNALLYLGKIYFEGKLIKRSIPKAIDYLNKASILGNIQAKYNLAILYASKTSNEYHDYKKAYDIFLQLAQDGYAPSQNKIGLFLTYGIGGIKTDYKEAVKWYEASAKQCYEDAECNLAFMYVNGKGVWKNFGRAHVFAQKGYKNGNQTCKTIWEKHHLEKYPEDKGFKFNFFVKPCE